MLATLKGKAGQALLLAADVAGMVLFASGAAVGAIVGKLMLAVVLLAVALGFFLRLSGRRRVPAPVAPPRWTRATAAGLAVLEVAVLTEATDLPVRFHQPGFETWHWGLVVLALLAAYALNMRVLAALRSKPERGNETPPSRAASRVIDFDRPGDRA